VPQAIIFDVDGTLVDSVDLHAHAWQDTFRHYGKEVPFDDVRAQIGKGGDQLMPVFFPQEQLARVGQEMQAFRSKLYKAKYMHQVRAFPKVRDLFERIRREGKQIALASSAETDEFQANLSLLQIGDLVNASTSAGDAARSKPFPDIFEAAIAKLDVVSAAHAVAVGDTHYDADAAARIGLPIVGLLCGGWPEATLREWGCVEVWRDPEDLLRHFEQTRLHAD
jgi:HAD superfamily hydrolase (TIGR01549 family)